MRVFFVCLFFTAAKVSEQRCRVRDCVRDEGDLKRLAQEQHAQNQSCVMSNTCCFEQGSVSGGGVVRTESD